MSSTETVDAGTAGRGAPVIIAGLVKSYNGFVAVDHIDLDIRAGEFLTLLGPSGSGKTTTLSMIAGFTSPTGGSVVVNGRDITTTLPHKRNIGMVFQNYSLFPHLSVSKNVEFPLRQRGVSRTERRALANAALAMVELSAKAKSKPSQLSGGQQQRVALSRALVFSPTLLLMDEPFGALDRALREKMQIELRRIHKELGVTVIFVTHDQQEALTLSDRIAIFDRGRIEQLGTPQELYESPTSVNVATFLGESNLITGEIADEVLITVSGLRLAAPGAPNGMASLMLRPERLRLSSSTEISTGGGTSIVGIVQDVTYLGRDLRLDLSTEAGPIITRLEPGVPVPTRGAQVTVCWERDACVVLPSKLHQFEQSMETS